MARDIKLPGLLFLCAGPVLTSVKARGSLLETEGGERGQDAGHENSVERSRAANRDIDASRPDTLSKLVRSAPIRVPRLPPIQASGAASWRESSNAITYAVMAGRSTGTVMPDPGTGVASQCISSATAVVAPAPSIHRPRIMRR